MTLSLSGSLSGPALPAPAARPFAAPQLAAAPGAAPQAPAAQRRAAEAFEAQVLGALLQPMFEGLATDGPFGGGSAEAQWRPMLVEHFGRAMARAGGVGLGASVLAEMQRMQAAAASEAAVTAAAGSAGE